MKCAIRSTIRSEGLLFEGGGPIDKRVALPHPERCFRNLPEYFPSRHFLKKFGRDTAGSRGAGPYPCGCRNATEKMLLHYRGSLTIVSPAEYRLTKPADRGESCVCFFSPSTLRDTE
ncbi:MAG: hypothetical protein OXF02_07635 [Simkaniaceae bacterium]|nr:hypothetical protein [Simkaniaceae bacterium]